MNDFQFFLDSAQPAVSALAAGAGQAASSNSQSEFPSDVGGLGGPGGPRDVASQEEPEGIKALNGGALGGNSLGGGEIVSGGNMEGNSFEGANMKKVGWYFVVIFLSWKPLTFPTDYNAAILNCDTLVQKYFFYSKILLISSITDGGTGGGANSPPKQFCRGKIGSVGKTGEFVGNLPQVYFNLETTIFTLALSARSEHEGFQ